MLEINPKITNSPVYPGRPDLREKNICKYLINKNLVEDLVNKIFEQIFVVKSPEDHPQDLVKDIFVETLSIQGFRLLKPRRSGLSVYTGIWAPSVRFKFRSDEVKLDS